MGQLSLVVCSFSESESTWMLNVRRWREDAQTTRPSPTPNHNVAKRIINVAAAAIPLGSPIKRLSIPAMLTSAAPNPHGRAEMAPITVEKERIKTAMEKVFHPSVTPNPKRTRNMATPSPSQATVPRETAVIVARGRKRMCVPS